MTMLQSEALTRRFGLGTNLIVMLVVTVALVALGARLYPNIVQ